MMKKLAILIFSLFGTSVFASVANVCTANGMLRGNRIFGAAVCSTGTIGELSVFGPAILNGTQLMGDLTVKGPLHTAKVTMQNVSVFGRADMEDSQVKGSLNVHGRIDMTNTAVAKDMLIYGAVSLNKSQLDGSADIYGALSAKQSQLKSAIVVYGDYIGLSASHAKDLVIKEGHNFNFEQKFEVVLKNKSVVQGNITFSGSKPGKVFVLSGSSFTGKIINGKAVHH